MLQNKINKKFKLSKTLLKLLIRYSVNSFTFEGYQVKTMSGKNMKKLVVLNRKV